jgi:hypothetical protein
LIANAPEEVKDLMEQAKQAYNEYYACLSEQAKSMPETQPGSKTNGPNSYRYMEMTDEAKNCAEKGKKAAKLIEKAAAYTNSNILCGCLTSTPTTTLNTNCSDVLKTLNAIRTAYYAKKKKLN